MFKQELNTIRLEGCTPEPLSHYLKALGILRLLVEQGKDRTAKGYWQAHAFVLATQRSPDELEQFFLHEYCPTPLVAPWNGSTGFYEKDNQRR
jgi:CRISPR-associated protein Csx17